MSKEQARRVLAHKVVKEVLAEQEGAAKTTLLAGMAKGDRVGIQDDDGTDLGAVSYSNGRKAPKVTGPTELLAWVKDGYPDEVQNVETIRPAFLSKLLGWCKDYKEPVTPTGEVIPGIEYAEGDPFLTVRATDDARDRVRVALGIALPELTAGDQ